MSDPLWGKEEMLSLSQLKVERYDDKPDAYYQRGITSIAEKIYNGYDARSLGRLLVAKISGGKYAILDGQNRAFALERLG